MKTLLALECATDQCSVALAIDDTILQEIAPVQRNNSKILLPMVNSLLKRGSKTLDDLSGLCITLGPGSFTGIRIGVAIAQGLAFGKNLPVFTWSTLELMAKEWLLNNQNSLARVVCALDARMNEIYWAAYQWDAQTMREVQAPALISINEFQTLCQQIESETVCLGSAFEIDQLKMLAGDTSVCPQAATMLKLIQAYPESLQRVIGAENLQPLYLRNEITWKKRSRIREGQISTDKPDS